MTPVTCVLLDIDGTLLDSNAAHAESWHEVLNRHGHAAALDDVRACIGQGTDKLMPAMTGLSADSDEAKQMTEERQALFKDRFMPTLQPTRGARALVEHLRAQGLHVIVATSAGPDELRGLLQRAGVDDLLPEATTSGDASSSKPDPDIVDAALRKAGATADESVMIGDTPFDVEAARKAGVRTIALRCGGHWDDAAFADAVAIYDDPADLLAQFEQSVLQPSQ